MSDYRILKDMVIVLQQILDVLNNIEEKLDAEVR